MLEALVGAYLVHGGPCAADALLAYLGLPVPCPCPSPATRPPDPPHWPLAHRDCQCW